jgi:hypothetical protein
MKHHILTVTTLASALLAGCSSEDELSQLSVSADNVVRITASVSDPQTRAGYTTDDLTQFGLSISNPVSSAYSYNNIKVEKSGNEWIPDESVLWHNLTDTVDIVAVAPYSSKAGNLCGVSNYEVSVEEDQEKDITSSDLLVFKKTALVPVDCNGVLDIKFDHAMSLLNVVVKFSKNSSSTDFLTANPIYDLKICGTKVNGKCDFTVATPVVTASGNDTKDITAHLSGFIAETATAQAQATYECILIPQSVAANGFSIATYTSSDTYYWVSSKALTFKGGNVYELDLEL